MNRMCDISVSKQILYYKPKEDIQADLEGGIRLVEISQEDNVNVGCLISEIFSYFSRLK